MLRALLIACLAMMLAGAAQAQQVAGINNPGAGNQIGGGSEITNPGGVVTQDPGPSAALFANPYYSCTTNKYISTTGSDSANGSIGTPWLTFNHADSTTPTAGTCINVEPGTYAAGASITHGGNLASSTGYVVYRCTTLNGCTITDGGGQSVGGVTGAAFAVGANYIIIDGFTIAASPAQGANTTGIKSCNSSCGVDGGAGVHHIWALNNSVSGYGESGIRFGEGEFMYIVHNKTFNNSAAPDCNGGNQGSGIAMNGPVATAAYSLTADDQNNPVTGNTGTLFRNFLEWNVTYNNYINGNCSNHDGNGIILDTWGWNCGTGGAGCTSGMVPYTNGGLVAFNVSYTNGGGGVHIFSSQYVVVANNSCYNNYLDPNNTASGRPCFDSADSYGNTEINNVAYAICGSGNLASNNAAGPNGPGNTSTTTLANAGGISASATSVTLTSASEFPGNLAFGATGWYGSNDYRLPGGNQIQIDNEVMLVAGGFGTTTLTVQRAFYGTTAATHSNGATITWVPDYFANNVTNVSSSCGGVDVNGPYNGDVYSSTQNKTTTATGWTNVGNTSTGSETTQPVGTNFALSAASAPIGYGQITTLGQTFLPAQAVDAGACGRALATCP